MVLANDVVLAQNKADKYRAKAAATFEVLPRLMGFNEDVVLRAVEVNYARNLVYFHFAGEGLDQHAEGDYSYRAYEGQEAAEITPPTWQKIQSQKNSEEIP